MKYTIPFRSSRPLWAGFCLITLTIKGDGPIGSLTVTADSHGNVKGFPGNPSVDIPSRIDPDSGAVKLDENNRAEFCYRLIGENFPKTVGQVSAVFDLPGTDHDHYAVRVTSVYHEDETDGGNADNVQG